MKEKRTFLEWLRLTESRRGDMEVAHWLVGLDRLPPRVKSRVINDRIRFCRTKEEVEELYIEYMKHSLSHIPIP